MILAYEIVSNTDKSVLILEKKKKFSYDKNLCFWNKPENLVTKIADNYWKKIVIKVNKEKKLHESEGIKYLRLNSKTFYNFYLEKFNNKKNLFLQMNTSIQKVSSQEDKVIIKTKKNNFESGLVFDSRYEKYNDKNVKLFQHFSGIEIETQKPIFDKNEIILMDIQNKKNLFNFIYLLPFSERRALIESTYFSPEIFKKDIYLKDIKKYLHKKFNLKNYKIKYEEFGVLPMNKLPDNSKKLVYKIGTAGNWTRLSTGYTLQNAFMYSKQIVDCLKGKTPIKIREKYVFKFLDDIFCNFILMHPDDVKIFFIIFFFKNSLLKIVKFLNYKAGLIEIFKIILSLPKIKLIQTFFSYKK